MHHGDVIALVPNRDHSASDDPFAPSRRPWAHRSTAPGSSPSAGPPDRPELQAVSVIVVGVLRDLGNAATERVHGDAGAVIDAFAAVVGSSADRARRRRVDDRILARRAERRDGAFV